VGQEVSDMMRSVMMMSSAEDELVFETGLEVVPLGVVPDPAGAPELVVEGTDPAEAPELEVEGTVEPVGAGVSPPAAEAFADIGREKTRRNQRRVGSTAQRRKSGGPKGSTQGVTSSGSRRQVHERAGKPITYKFLESDPQHCGYR
jgi:hypothetical protein